METCSHCGGSGYVEYEEDYRYVRDACYHCGNTGEVDETTLRVDLLRKVACTIAYIAEREYCAAVNQDPEGEGYAFHAAENMMSVSDYFNARVYEREDRILADLQKLDQTMQDVLIAWNEEPVLLPASPSPNGSKLQVDGFAEDTYHPCVWDDDYIPF